MLFSLHDNNPLIISATLFHAKEMHHRMNQTVISTHKCSCYSGYSSMTEKRKMTKKSAAGIWYKHKAKN